MNLNRSLFWGTSLAVALLIVAGCQTSDSLSSNGDGESGDQTTADSTGIDQSAMDGGGMQMDMGGSSDGKTAEISANLAKLSDGDRKTAEHQHHCPVTGQPLGSMGTPIKVPVEGQDVWICCPGCKDKLLESPAKYLAQLKQE